MNCEFINANILDYLDNQLGETDMHIFQNHLEECAQCRQLVNEIRQTYQFAQRPDDFHVSSSFINEATAAAFKQEARVVPMLYRVLKPIAVAASIGLGILIGNGEWAILYSESNINDDEAVAISTTSASDYSLWQTLEEYGNEN